MCCTLNIPQMSLVWSKYQHPYHYGLTDWYFTVFKVVPYMCVYVGRVLSVQIQSYDSVIEKSLLGLRKFFNTTQWSRNKKNIGRKTTHQATNSILWTRTSFLSSLLIFCTYVYPFLVCMFVIFSFMCKFPSFYTFISN